MLFLKWQGYFFSKWDIHGMLHNGLKGSLWTSETFWQLPDTTQVFSKIGPYMVKIKGSSFLLYSKMPLNGFSFKKK